MTKDEAVKELEEYLRDADKAVSEDEEYIRGWKSALLVSLEVVHNITDTMDLLKEQEAKTLETLTIYANEQCFTLKEAIVNLIKYGLRDAYCNVRS